MTKSGLFKDERDTERRRTRHRDGRLLRGGLGLTTGLGWSDSEDEDAPSPLTHRLSTTMRVGRNKSSASLRSSAGSSAGRPKLGLSKSYYGATQGKQPHPLSKSLSANALAGASGAKSAPVSARNSKGDMEDADPDRDDLEYVLGKGAMGPPSAPPFAGAYQQQQRLGQKQGVKNYSYPMSLSSVDRDSNSNPNSNRGSVASSSSRASLSPPMEYRSISAALASKGLGAGGRGLTKKASNASTATSAGRRAGSPSS